MNRRHFLTTSAAAAASLAPQAPAQSARPNIVYILADDLGYGDLRCYNDSSAVPTPNYDRVAREGVRFTDCHSPSSVCTPTRYGILTGRYCWRSRLKSGVLQGYHRALIEPGRATVPSMLKSAGYHTAGVGKWHLGFGSTEPVDYSKPFDISPNSHGFDYYYGIPASLDFEPYCYVENNRAVDPPTAFTPGLNVPRGVFWRQGKVAPSFVFEDVLPTLAKKATTYIAERAREPQRPFFLYLPLTGPHTPWLPTRKFEGKSAAGIYGDFVAMVDDVIGQVTEALRQHGLENNTLLILTSDNGAHWTPEDRARYPHRANAWWRGQKADIHDAGHRIPFLARWPGRIAPGTVSGQLTCLTDLFATAAEINGIALKENEAEDSFSFLSAATAAPAKSPARASIVHHSAQGMFALRRSEWKLAESLGSGGFTEPQKESPTPNGPTGQLYNLMADPAESDNLFLRNPTKVAELTAELNAIRTKGRSRA
ncbi:MAG: arylsulfatase [Acidobacteria bacterium]|nr:arylsulfatase [Acidobacteriota bacterium]